MAWVATLFSQASQTYNPQMPCVWHTSSVCSPTGTFFSFLEKVSHPLINLCRIVKNMSRWATCSSGKGQNPPRLVPVSPSHNFTTFLKRLGSRSGGLCRWAGARRCGAATEPPHRVASRDHVSSRGRVGQVSHPPQTHHSMLECSIIVRYKRREESCPKARRGTRGEGVISSRSRAA